MQGSSLPGVSFARLLRPGRRFRGLRPDGASEAYGEARCDEPRLGESCLQAVWHGILPRETVRPQRSHARPHMAAPPVPAAQPRETYVDVRCRTPARRAPGGRAAPVTPQCDGQRNRADEQIAVAGEDSATGPHASTYRRRSRSCLRSHPASSAGAAPATSRSSRGTFRPRARQSSPMARAPRTTRARPTRSSTRCAQTPVSAADQGEYRQEAIPAARSVDGLAGRAGSALSARRGTVSRPPGTVTRGHRIVPGALRDARTGRGLRVDRHRRVVGWREAPSARSSVQRPQATTGDSSRRRLPISSFWSQRAVEETVGCSRSSTSARQTRFSRVTRVKDFLSDNDTAGPPRISDP